MPLPLAPLFLRPYLVTAAHWLEQGCIVDIEFSDSTYQIEVHDPVKQNALWTFLQLDDEYAVRDAFCSCEDEESSLEDGSRGCVHLAAAWLRIFHGGNEPLHVRFRHSLWHQLCYLYRDKLGDEPESLRLQDEGHYAAFSAGRKRICALIARTSKGKQRLQALLYDRQSPTEETSIKFSNLSHEELQLWRIGQPSSELRYELSFWSDLAKWMLWLQEEGHTYKVSFQAEDNSLPHHITITFEDFSAEFYLSVANWPAIIPALATLNTPLRIVDERQQGIDSIVYHPEMAALEIVPCNHRVEACEVQHADNAIDLDGWRYIPNVGFFADTPHELLSQLWLKGSQVDKLLNEQTSLVIQLLKGCRLHLEPVKVSYQLEFDRSWNLHITCYVLEPGDLTEKRAALFGQWAYLNDDGFYHLEGVDFSQAHLKITPAQLPEFIAQQRLWLNKQPGFQTHISAFEEQLTYQVDNNGRLSLHQSLQPDVAAGLQRDFGQWFYIAGEGFYTKALPAAGRPVRPGISVNAEQVSLFIRMHAEELYLIKNFFSDKCPVVKSGLRLIWAPVGQSDSIKIIPDYALDPAYSDNQVLFFDEYVYVDQEGFSELPLAVRLPEAYRQPLTLVGEELEHFLAYQLAELRLFIFEIDPRIVPPTHLQLEVTDLEAESKAHGWYRIQLQYTSSTGSISAQTLWQTLQRKKKYYCSPAGLLDLSSDAFMWLRSVRKQRFVGENTLLLSTLEVIRLQALAQIPQPKLPQARHLLEALIDFHEIVPPPLVGLKSVLRPYQQLGLQWLWSLYQKGLSGLLCDDMGLGKTHQAMALLDAIFHTADPATPCYAIVICPTSVLYHWQEKLSAFLPSVPVSIFYGSGRRLELHQQSRGILLTSYGIARNESERLSSLIFAVAIFDEIQTAKNHRSRIYHALLAIQAHMRLGMTGTPIENHLRELKALFDLTLPTYLPADKDFREYFVKPIEKGDDRSRKQLLSRLIKPFVLRRKKEEVLTDLPPKIEETIHCSLLPNQRALYNSVLEQSREAVLHQLQDGRSSIPYLHIFSILSALKQICNHPAAYLKDPDSYQEHASGKWNLFVELLQEARQSGQKVIVFSHYLAMLAIMARYLTEQSIGFSLLQGNTQDRAQQVQRFQNDPSCEVFLGSLQAAGTGIDLTAATVVIHYDRWWNAAKERQATDRAYRIGQSRGVQVFKLVTKDSFEERIDALIRTKGQLMEDIISADDHQVLKRLDRHEIMELLKQVEEGPSTVALPLNDEL
jgi:superfamily II DNA or RNA helicase